MGKDKEKDEVDESSEESFPASDPPSWTASPRDVAPRLQSPAERGAGPGGLPERQSSVRRQIARQATRIPSNLFLWAGLALAATSAGLMAGGKKQAGLFVGILAPSILLLGLYEKLHENGARDYRPNVH